MPQLRPWSFVKDERAIVKYKSFSLKNVTHCKKKSPAFVSRPHFYQADDSYRQAFQYGLRPDADKHESKFWVEPESSIPVKVEMRLQLNILLRKVEGIDYLFKNLQEVMYPVFWFEVSRKN